MLKYEKKITDRKVLVNRLVELTGEESHYTRVPRCAYEIGAYTVEKDGALTVPEELKDDEIIRTLTEEGLIGEESVVAEARIIAVKGNRSVSEPQSEAPVEPAAVATEDWEPDEEDDTEESTEEGQAQPEVWRPDTDLFAETEETEETAEEAAPEETDEPENTEEAEPEPETEDSEEPETEDIENEESETEDIENEESETEDIEIKEAEPEPSDNVFPLDAAISLPLTGHTVTSLTNLVSMVYSRGPLLSKATGGVFLAEKELVDDLLDETAIHTIADLRTFLADYERENGSGILGLKIKEDRVVFDGFTGVPDAEHLQSFEHLAACMDRMAKKQKRVLAKETEVENERYSMRTWLLRLGMNGGEFKTARKHLMEHLTGHTAFRTAEEADRAKAKARKKRDELRAAKAAAETASASVATADTAGDSGQTHRAAVPEQILEAGA